MKKFYCVFALTFFFLFVSAELFAQAVTDPASIPVYEASGPITVDGILDEADWSVRAPHLMFRFNGSPSELSHTPTNDGLEVKPVYADTSTNYVKFLRSGTNLYISMDSDDKQVCRFGDSWEGDGLFMKIKNSAGTDVEFKLYYNLPGINPEMNYEGPAYGNGVGYKKPGTIVNDSTNVDAGYSAELMIDLTGLGFTASTTSIELMLVIFDPDNYSDGVGAWGPNGNFGKQWWGSEWGPEMRTLMLSNTVVPVELTSFTGSYVGHTAQLLWSTSSETNNYGFEVQRSNNSEFVTVGFVAGNGTTTNTLNYSYTDKEILPGTNYSYRLKQIDFNGQFEFSNVIELGHSNPVDFSLSQNYPNPFNPGTKISFSLPVKSNVKLDVYNMLGQKVISLFNGNLEAGIHNMDLNASDLTSGIYIYSINAIGENGSKFVSSKKMTLIK